VDWQKVDLTIEGQIGGAYHPNLPWQMRRELVPQDLYMDLFDTDREGILMLVRNDESWPIPFFENEKDQKDMENSANSFHNIFKRWPQWIPNTWNWLNGAMPGGDCCDRCATRMNLLNFVNMSCCDKCEREMSEEMAANPNVVFAFEHGGLRIVA
jgi:hypothetical protein